LVIEHQRLSVPAALMNLLADHIARRGLTVQDLDDFA
jgi:hypothetical protein